jgi:hypothetical protein
LTYARWVRLAGQIVGRKSDYDDRVLIRRRYIAEAEAEDKSQLRRALSLFLADADERSASAFLADRDPGSVAG